MTIPNIPEFPTIEDLNRQLRCHKATQRKCDFIASATTVYAENLNKTSARKPVIKLLEMIERFMNAAMYNQALGKSGVTTIKSGRKYVEKAIANVPTPEQSAVAHALMMQARANAHSLNYAQYRFNQVLHQLNVVSNNCDRFMRCSFNHELKNVFRFNSPNLDNIKNVEFWAIADMLATEESTP